MTYKSSIVFAWSLFLGILFIELGVDYLIRIMSGDFRYSGIPEHLWFLIHIIAAGVSGYFIIYGLKYLDKFQHKMIHILVNFVIGAIFYVIITGLYILGLGIDSL